jgi:hypothetical protein
VEGPEFKPCTAKKSSTKYGGNDPTGLAAANTKPELVKKPPRTLADLQKGRHG